tara:strand:- start:2786 stop:3790 length:1005 start_codon:yes stop_codon:yes gene_type:complete
LKIPTSLIEIAEKVGNDITLVQGPGGNISYKKNNIMYIKASGTKMSDAKKKNIFVKTDLLKIITAIESNDPDPIKNSWSGDGLMKPSIETSMHAIMPHTYVLHVHCVNTLSWIVQKNFQKRIGIHLKDIKWIAIPYKKPGVCLSNALKVPLRESNANVIFLSNHGIIAGSNSANDVFSIIKNISQKLFLGELEKKIIDFSKIDKYLFNKKYKLPEYEYVHQIAFSYKYSQMATKGIIFPDQIVFLENGIRYINNYDEFIKICNLEDNKLPILIIKNVGVLVPKCLKEVSEDILLGLFMTILRIPQNNPISYLNNSDIKDIINWDMEKHRQMMNK